MPQPQTPIKHGDFAVAMRALLVFLATSVLAFAALMLFYVLVLSHLVGRDEMSRGIAGSLFVTFMAMPASMAVGLVVAVRRMPPLTLGGRWVRWLAAHRRPVLVAMGLLDAWLLARTWKILYLLVPQEWDLSYGFTQCQGVLVFSLALSSYGHLLQRSWAFFVYYAQVPFRFMSAALTFGFFMTLGAPLGMRRAGFVLAVALELLRLVTCIVLHRGCGEVARTQPALA